MISVSLEQLLLARARIARLGEKSHQNWWPSDAHGRAGQILLERLFPRTAPWSAVELSLDAACAAHRQGLPAIPVVTLFDLGEKINRACSDLLLQKKLRSEDASNYAELVELHDLVPGDLLVAVKQSSEGLNLDRTVQVGDVAASADLTAPDLWMKLVAGYQFSSPGHLVIPYLRVV